MTGNAKNRLPAWLQLALIAILFAGPLILATWLYLDGSLRPSGRTNHGAIIDPIINLRESLPNSALADLSEDSWLLVYANVDDCAAECRETLYVLRQSRLMLGNDMQRLLRVFLRGPVAPDTVFIEEQHPGLAIVEEPLLIEFLEDRRPRELSRGGFFLVDPLGNLVMYFPPEIDPGDMVDDIAHLLDLSQIG
ncbi:MAG TPA: hypothetical protein VKZ91_13720 [Woeseiaceae bacterium]|nr:hypothetical protein [Woeseiaceae bacterium]